MLYMFTDYRIYIVEYIVQFTKFGIHKVQLYIVDRYIDHLHSESWDIPDAIILQKKSINRYKNEQNKMQFDKKNTHIKCLIMNYIGYMYIYIYICLCLCLCLSVYLYALYMDIVYVYVYIGSYNMI